VDFAPRERKQHAPPRRDLARHGAVGKELLGVVLARERTEVRAPDMVAPLCMRRAEQRLQALVAPFGGYRLLLFCFCFIYLKEKQPEERHALVVAAHADKHAHAGRAVRLAVAAGARLGVADRELLRECLGPNARHFCRLGAVFSLKKRRYCLNMAAYVPMITNTGS
jgi:hypothetical protein